jgi:uncharacterized protein DUF2252
MSRYRRGQSAGRFVEGESLATYKRSQMTKRSRLSSDSPKVSGVVDQTCGVPGGEGARPASQRAARAREHIRLGVWRSTRGFQLGGKPGLRYPAFRCGAGGRGSPVPRLCNRTSGRSADRHQRHLPRRAPMPGPTATLATITRGSSRTGRAPRRIEQMDAKAMATYGTLCGSTLARAHARSGDRVAIVTSSPCA